MPKKTHQLFTCAVPQRHAGVVVFPDERVDGEECAQTAALLKTKEGAVPEQHVPDSPWQASQA